MAVRRLVGVSVVLMGVVCHCSVSAAKAPLPGYLHPVRAGVEQVAPGVLQFWMEVAEPPIGDPDPDRWLCFQWFVDTDRDRNTGQKHGAVGSEYNIRAVLRDDPDNGGGFIDGIEGRRGGQAPIFVDGTTVRILVTANQIGNPSHPSPFAWNCEVRRWDGAGESGVQAHEFDWSATKEHRDRPARVVVEPMLLLSHGATELRPWVRAMDFQGVPLSVDGRDVKLYSYSPLASVAGRNLRAVLGKVGPTRVTASVDGVMSVNAARVMVGDVEVIPGILELDPQVRTTGRASLLVTDARGTAIPLAEHRISVWSDNPKIATVSTDGWVMAVPGVSGKDPETAIRYSFDGVQSTNCCAAVVSAEALPLLPEQTVYGCYVVFGFPVVAEGVRQVGSQFQEMCDAYAYVPTLDAGYQELRLLFGTTPPHGGRQHAVAKTWGRGSGGGGSGNPVGGGFDPFTKGTWVQTQQGVPTPGLMFHEMAHNFAQDLVSAHRILWSSPIGGGSFGHGLTNLSAVYVTRKVVERGTGYGLPSIVSEYLNDPDGIDSFPTMLRRWARYLADYERNGALFPEQFNCEVAAGIYLQLAQTYGWDMYPRFFAVFSPPYEEIDFTPRNEMQRTTFLIAALSAAAAVDLRPDFERWGITCDDHLFGQLLPDLTWRASQGDQPPALRVTAPASGARLTMGKPVHVSVTVAPDAQVDILHFLVNGKDCALRGKAPYEFDWNTEKEAPGVYFLRAVAEMRDGTQQKSVPVPVEVAASE
jgi:hypothetical protein